MNRYRARWIKKWTRFFHIKIEMFPRKLKIINMYFTLVLRARAL